MLSTYSLPVRSPALQGAHSPKVVSLSLTTAIFIIIVVIIIVL